MSLHNLILNQIRFFQMNNNILWVPNLILITFDFVIQIWFWKLKKGTTKNQNIFRKCVFIEIWFTIKNKKMSAICNLEIFDHEFHNLQTHSQTFNWFHLKHFPLQHKTCLLFVPGRNMKTMRAFFTAHGISKRSTWNYRFWGWKN